MTEYDRDNVEARLRARAEEIAARLGRLRQGDLELREGGDLADYDQHEADSASETLEEELDETTRIMLEAEAAEVGLAQRRLAEGTYGTCVDCGKEIPAPRLEAIPEANRCIDDQRGYEGRLRQIGPPADLG